MRGLACLRKNRLSLNRPFINFDAELCLTDEGCSLWVRRRRGGLVLWQIVHVVHTLKSRVESAFVAIYWMMIPIIVGLQRIIEARAKFTVGYNMSYNVSRVRHGKTFVFERFELLKDNY